VWLLFLFWTCAERLSAVRLVSFVAVCCMTHAMCLVMLSFPMLVTVLITTYGLLYDLGHCCKKSFIDLRLCEGGLVVWYSLRIGKRRRFGHGLGQTLGIYGIWTVDAPKCQVLNLIQELDTLVRLRSKSHNATYLSTVGCEVARWIRCKLAQQKHLARLGSA